MIILVGVAATAAVGLAWVGHKVSVRLEAWGQGMNACDDIFRMAGEHQAPQVDLRSFRETPPAVTTHGVHLGAEAK